MLGLQEIQTAIQFVSAQSGGGSSPSAQTGDAIFFLVLIAALACIAIGCGLYAFSKKRSFASTLGGSHASPKYSAKKVSVAQKLAIAIAIIAAICSIGLGVAKAPVLKAFAENNGTNVTVWVDETNGGISKIETATIDNSTNGDFYLTEAKIVVNDEAKSIAGINDVEFTIESNGDVVFQGKPNTPFTPSDNLLFWYQQSAGTKYSISNISAETAKALINKTPYTLILTPKNTTRITYDANGADEGTAPDAQKIDWTDEFSPAFNLQGNTGGLKKTGKVFDGWNTKPDGTGEQYQASQAIGADDPAWHTGKVLYAKWSNTITNFAVNFYSMEGVFPEPGRSQMRSVDQTIGAEYQFPPQPIMDDDNWEFQGWWTMPIPGQTGDKQIKEGDKVEDTTITSLFARWVHKTADITFNGNGGNPDTQTFTWNYGDKYDLTKVTTPVNPAGTSFLGWYTDQEGGSPITGEEIVSDNSPRSIWAHWDTDVKVAVTFDSNNETGEKQETLQTYGQKYSFDDVTTPSYVIPGGWDDATFLGWYTDPTAGNKVTEDTTVTVLTAHTLYAHWKMPTTIKKFYGNGGIFHDGDKDYVEIEQTYNTTYVLPDVNPEFYGHSITGWYTAQEGGQKIDGTKCMTVDPIDISAHWEILKFNVKFYPGSQGHFSTGDTYIELEQTYGQAYKMPEVEVVSDTPGMEFENAWYSADGNGGYKINPDKVEDCNTRSIYAGYIGVEVTVTLKAEGSEDQTSTERYLQTYKLADIDAPTKDNYDFAGWYLGNTKIVTGTDNDSVVQSYTAITLEARWTPKSLDMTFDGAPGTYGVKTTTTVKETYGTTYVLPSNPSNSGYDLEGWYATDPDNPGSEVQITTTKDVDLRITRAYAKWTPIKFNIKFMPNEGDIEGPDTIEQTFATNYQLATAKRTGYTLKCWNTAPTGAGVDIDADTKITDYTIKTLYAKWEATNVTATFNANGGAWNTGATTIGVTETYGENYKFPEAGNPSRTGYNFVGWFTEAEAGTQVTASTVVQTESDHNIYAHWQAAKIKVTFNHNDFMTGISTSTVRVIDQTFDSLYQLDTPLTYTGWDFDGWYLNPTLSADSKIDPETTKVTNAEAHNVWGKWIAKTPKVTFNGKGGTWGTETTVDKQQTYGQQFVFPDTNPVREGYTLEAWYVDPEYGSTPIYSTDICRFVEDTTVYAKWSPKRPTVTFDSDGGTPALQYITQTYGLTYIIPTGTAVPTKTGYTFAGWWTTDVEPQMVDSTTDMLTATDHTLKAHWTPNIYSIALQNPTNAPLTQIYEKYGEGFYSDSDCESPITPTMETGIETPTKTGYNFTGYYTANNKQIITAEGKLNTAVSNTEFSNNATVLTAKFEAMSGIKVNFDAVTNGGKFQDGEDVKSQNQTYDAHYVLTPDIPWKTGNNFNGWWTTPDSAEGEQITADNIVKITSETTLYARYISTGDASRSVVVSFKCGDTYLASTYVNYITTTQSLSVPAATVNGYTPNRPSVEVTPGNENVNEVIQYTENTVKITYNVAADSPNMGIVNPSGEQTIGVVTGNATCTAMPIANYEFVKWTDGSGAEVSTDATFTPEKVGGLFVAGTYNAHFQPKTCNLTFFSANSAGGSVSQSSLAVPYGTQCAIDGSKITFTPAEGGDPIAEIIATPSSVKYSFENWQTFGGGTTIQGDSFFLANFKENKAQFTFAANEFGKVNINKLTLTYGTSYQIENGNLKVNVGDDLDENTIVVSAIKDGYEFVNWTKEDGSAIAASGTIELGMEKLTANFQIRQITIKYNLDPSTSEHGDITTASTTVEYYTNYSIDKTGAITFKTEGKEPQTVTPFSAKTGYHFKTWDVPTEGTIETTGVDQKESNWYVTFTINTYEMNFTTSPEGKGTISLDGENDIPYNTPYTLVPGTDGNYDQLVFGNVNSPILVATPDVTSGYSETAPYWTDAAGQKITTGGIVTDETTFTANYTKDPKKIIRYEIPNNMSQENGSVLQYDSKAGEWAPTTYFEITVDVDGVITEQQGAKVKEGPVKAENAKVGGRNYDYYFLYWTNKATGEVVSEAGLEEGSIFVPTKKETEGWDNTTYVCNFATPVLIWDELNETETITYSQENYKGIERDVVDTVFPVKNHTYIDPRYKEECVFPSWCNYDGSPILNPRHIKIEPIFKRYKKLTSTSGWFWWSQADPWDALSGDIAIGIDDVERNLEDITGLENIYTENLEDTSYMFLGDVVQSYKHHFTSIDLSSWNTPNLWRTEGMFMNCRDLQTIKFPDSPVDETSPRFGENAFAFKYMFTNCRSLRDVTINGNFGAPSNPDPDLVKEYGSSAWMFDQCYGLKSVNIAGDNFGKYIGSAERMFYECESLEEINIPSKTMCSNNCQNYYRMFADCYSLKSIDISSYSVNREAYIEDMFGWCNDITDITIGAGWTSPKTLADAGMPTNWDPPVWYMNHEIDTYTNEQIPTMSGPGNFSKLTAKAVYTKDENANVGQLTFYFDYVVHEGTTFSINTNTGFRGNYLNAPSWFDAKSYVDGVEITDMGGAQPLQQDNDSYGDLRPGDKDSGTYDLKYELKSKLDAPLVNVTIDASFANFKNLNSLAFWFCADSNGYCPFNNFEGLKYINTKNIYNVMSMFGGLDLNVKYARDWMWNQYKIPNDYNIHSQDTFNSNNIVSKGKNYLDLSDFDSIIDEEGYLKHCMCTYKGMFANCTGLQSVKLPKYLGNYSYSLYEDLDNDMYVCMFENCHNLKTITNADSMYTNNQRFAYYMFAGCYNLESLDLRHFSTSNVDEDYYSSLDTWYNTWAFMFHDCDRLSSITVGEDWSRDYSLGYCDLPDTYDPRAEGHGNPWKLVVQKGEETDYEERDTYDIPYWEDFENRIATYVRDTDKIAASEKTIKVVSSDPELGEIVPANFEYKYISPVSYSVTESGLLRVGTSIVQGVGKGVNGLKNWSIDGEIIESGKVGDEGQYIQSDDPETTIIGHFGEVGNVAKAVFDDNNKTLTFYYDKEDHQGEGLRVFPVANDYGYWPTENKNVPSISWGIKSMDYMIKVPSWYRAVPNEIDVSDEQIASFRQETVEMDAATETVPLNKYKFYSRIDPKEVIFSESFKKNDEIKSISCWFMADSTNFQTVETFSSIVNDVKQNGFYNVNTTSLKNVAFTFGGIFAREFAEYDYRYGNNSPIIGPVLKLFNFIKDSLTPNGLNLNELLTFDMPYKYDTYGFSIKDLDMTDFDFSHLKDGSNMFANCLGLEHIKFAPNQTQNLTSFYGFFANDEFLGVNTAIEKPPIEGLNTFNTNNAVAMDFMFFGCSNLKTLDLSSFNTENVMPAVPSYVNPDEKGGLSEKSPYAPGMFHDCTRLESFTINADYDNTKPYHVAGWGINVNASGLYDIEGNPWIDEERNAVDSMYIPCLTPPMSPSEKVYTGTFTREQISEQSYIVKPETAGTGLIDGKDSYTYKVATSCQVSAVSGDLASLSFDNHKVKATGIGDYKFKCYKFGEGWGELTGTNVPSNFNEYYEADPYTPKTILAVFDTDPRIAKAVYSITNDGKGYVGQFNFVYDEATYTPGVDNVVAVYDVDPCWSDSNLPAWFKKGSKANAGSKLNRPVWRPEVEITLDKEGNEVQVSYIKVNFDTSFKNYSYLQSLSCWFMNGFSNFDGIETRLWANAFRFDSENFTGLSNIDTTNINNVYYMFGGNEFFNDKTGSYGTSINLDGFDPDHKLKTTAGMFANCVDLESINFGSFTTTNVTDMTRMFYNCRTLSSSAEYSKAILSSIDTSNATNMTEMFALSNYNVKTKDKVNADERYFIFGNNFNTSKVVNATRMFADIYDAASIVISGTDAFTLSNVTNAKGMFQNNWNMDRISAETSSLNMVNIQDASYMFSNCQRLKTTEALGGFVHIENATNTTYMFSDCYRLGYFNLHKNPSSTVIKDARYMFYNDKALAQVDFSNMLISKEALSDDPYKPIANSDYPYYAMLAYYDSEDDEDYGLESVRLFTISESWDLPMQNLWIREGSWYNENDKEPKEYQPIDIPYPRSGDKYHVWGTFGYENSAHWFDIVTDSYCWGNPLTQESQQDYFAFFNNAEIWIDSSDETVVNMRTDSGKFEHAVPNCITDTNGQFIKWQIQTKSSAPEYIDMEADHHYTFQSDPIQSIKAVYSGYDPYADFNKDTGALTFDFHEAREDTETMKYIKFDHDSYFEEGSYVPWRDIRGDVKSVSFTNTFNNGSFTSAQYWFAHFTQLTTFDAKNCTAFRFADREHQLGKTNDWAYAFTGCSSLQTIVLPDTAIDVYSFKDAFRDCSSLTSIDFGGLSLQHNDNGMFAGCSSINTLVFNRAWGTSIGAESDLRNYNQWIDNYGYNSDRFPWAERYSSWPVTFTIGLNTVQLKTDSDDPGVSGVDGKDQIYWNAQHPVSYGSRMDGSIYFYVNGVEGYTGTNYESWVDFDAYWNDDHYEFGYWTDPEGNKILENQSLVNITDANTQFVAKPTDRRNAYILETYNDTYSETVNEVTYLTDEEFDVWHAAHPDTKYSVLPYDQSYDSSSIFNRDYNRVVFDESMKYCTKIRSTAAWFKYYYNLTEVVGIEHLNMVNVWDARYMFYECESLDSINLSSWNTPSLEKMDYMFTWASRLKTVIFSDADHHNFTTRRLQTCYEMFNCCYALTNVDLSSWYAPNLTDCSRMFNNCNKLVSFGSLANLGAYNLKSCYEMFYYCYALREADISGIHTNNSTNQARMFYYNNELRKLNISGISSNGWDQTGNFLSDCYNITEITIGENLNCTLYDLQMPYYKYLLGPDGNVYRPDEVSSKLTGPGLYKVLQSVNAEAREYLQSNNQYDMAYIFGRVGCSTSFDEIVFGGPRHLYYMASGTTLWLEIRDDNGVVLDKQQLIASPRTNEGTMAYNPVFKFWQTPNGSQIQEDGTYHLFNADDYDSSTFYAVFDADTLKGTVERKDSGDSILHLYYGSVTNSPYESAKQQHWSICTNSKLKLEVGKDPIKPIYGGLEFPWNNAGMIITKVDTHESLEGFTDLTTMYNFMYQMKDVTSIDLTHLNINNVTNFVQAFTELPNCKEIKFGKKWECPSSNTLEIALMFMNCSNLQRVDLWKSGYIPKGQKEMFFTCDALRAISFGEGFNTDGVSLYQLGLRAQDGLTFINDITGKALTVQNIIPGGGDKFYGSFVCGDPIKLNFDFSKLQAVGTVTSDLPAEPLTCVPGARNAYIILDPAKPDQLQIKIDSLWTVDEKTYTITFTSENDVHVESWYLNGEALRMPHYKTAIVIPVGTREINISGSPTSAAFTSMDDDEGQEIDNPPVPEEDQQEAIDPYKES